MLIIKNKKYEKMKKNYFLTLLFTFCVTTLALTQDLVITGVFDGPLSGGTPKGLELFVINDIADLSIYGIGSANNGQGTDGEEFTFLAVSVTNGTYLYVATEETGFSSFFGFAPTYTTGSVGINGDDSIELYENGQIIDVYGDVNAVFSGEEYDYLDGWFTENRTQSLNA